VYNKAKTNIVTFNVNTVQTHCITVGAKNSRKMQQNTKVTHRNKCSCPNLAWNTQNKVVKCSMAAGCWQSWHSWAHTFWI